MLSDIEAVRKVNEQFKDVKPDPMMACVRKICFALIYSCVTSYKF